MRAYKGFLLDLDGTIYKGNEVIPEAVTFIKRCRQENIPSLYVTNNSSTTPEKIVDRLMGMGISCQQGEVITTSMATAFYLQELEKERPTNKKVFLIGEEGLQTAISNAGFTITDTEASYVIVGIDRDFTYEKLVKATRLIGAGATFVATNRDAALPTDKGLMPGNGSLVAAVSTASGKKPIVIGKPEEIIISYAMKKIGTTKEETLIIGDNLHTDIEAGANSGLPSLLVLTGFSTEEDAQKHHVKPTYMAKTLLHWWDEHM